MNTDLADLMRVMRRELWIKRRLVAGVYISTAVLFLALGWFWPKHYTSTSTILVNQQSILEPLMQGTAVTSGVGDTAGVAREIIFTRRAMDEVLRKSGWLEEGVSDLDKERLMNTIEGKTRLENVGENVIRLSFIDEDADRAYQTAQQLTNVFINHALQDKQRESREAYDFINGQVIQYHTKLKDAEQALKDFRSNNIDAQPGSEEEVQARIAALKERREATHMELLELQTERRTIQRQLAGARRSDGNDTEVDTSRYAERLADLEQELATLRLSYHDSYPDIVVLKGQIDSIRQAISASDNAADAAGGEREFRVGATGELYQQLRSRYSATESQLATLQERLEETEKLLAEEEDRLVRVSETEAQLSELMRDYEVNQEIYQSLMRQRENARISMNIDQEAQGLTFQVQEPAAMPLTPQGIRFSHFMAAGMLLSVALPLALIYGLILIDQRVRSKSVVSESVGLPVLASVYQMNRPTEFNISTFWKSIILLAIVLSWVIYGYVAWLRING